MIAHGFQDRRSGLRARHIISPDSSVIFTADSNHLAGHQLSDEVLLQSGPDPIPVPVTNKSSLPPKDSSEDESVASDSARTSFSRALKECQDRRLLRSGFMNKQSSATLSGIIGFPSPGTPDYHRNINVSAKVLLPYNNGKALPSKWEDAERWISSPASRHGSAVRTSFQQRLSKSKSGPLGAPGATPNSVVDGCKKSLDYVVGIEPSIARSISVHGCSVMMRRQSSLPVHQDDDVSRKDCATQVSPGRQPSISLPIEPIVEMQSIDSSKPVIKDVPVDERVTVTRWSKKDADWKRQPVEAPAKTRISKIQKEEAKICAWENLQRAKAEAALKKLERKLEKKRSSSMEKIMNKLRSAQKKAQEMRGAVINIDDGDDNKARQTARTLEKEWSLQKTRIGCFMWNPF
ncbi:uncharacterized protein LOC127265144 [Andrographis paniculata]|uniref:uncharacterized protein LOC127265144 n=1 Tax=Andrographis paniculata TaxID=175694 RepID=UPI0021E70118|nr:uncharacterized protein LOC127265144 [Andrographis paniculata]